MDDAWATLKVAFMREFAAPRTASRTIAAGRRAPCTTNDPGLRRSAVRG
jgi:hypothetical protein